LLYDKVRAEAAAFSKELLANMDPEALLAPQKYSRACKASSTSICMTRPLKASKADASALMHKSAVGRLVALDGAETQPAVLPAFGAINARHHRGR